MTHTERFGLFRKAIDDCGALAAVAETEFTRTLHKAVWAELQIAKRFYLPGAGKLIEGRVVDEDIKSLVSLPFPRIALLSETRMNNEDGTSERGWKITLASNSHESTPKLLANIDRGRVCMRAS
jgi:hypothetical protein